RRIRRSPPRRRSGERTAGREREPQKGATGAEVQAGPLREPPACPGRRAREVGELRARPSRPPVRLDEEARRGQAGERCRGERAREAARGREGGVVRRGRLAGKAAQLHRGREGRARGAARDRVHRHPARNPPPPAAGARPPPVARRGCRARVRAQADGRPTVPQDDVGGGRGHGAAGQARGKTRDRTIRAADGGRAAKPEARAGSFARLVARTSTASGRASGRGGAASEAPEQVEIGGPEGVIWAPSRRRRGRRTGGAAPVFAARKMNGIHLHVT
ncbi:hypothetical protein THAOC_37257, partial [Thalassiosira oceanica]